VRNEVAKKAYKTIGKPKIASIDVVPTGRTTVDLGPIKML
jgi:hypothetical protein